MSRVSVIIPAYNAMAYLPETMASVLNQNFTDFEAIVVNDGSSDETEQWVSQISDPRVKLVSQANQGLSGARNTGIKHAQGEFITFIDGDDFWEPTKLEKQVQYLAANPKAGLVYTWVAYVNERGKSTGRIVKNNAEGDVWQQLTERNIIECGSVAMIRRECFETVGVFDRDIDAAQDWDMWLRIAARYQFLLVREPLVFYRQHANNKSKNYAKVLEDLRTIIERAFQAAPFELLYLRNRSYGNVNLVVAWKCLQSSNKDYKQASYFRSQALKHCPQLCFSKEYIRLSLAIAVMQLFGANRYKKFLSLMYAVRRISSFGAAKS
jgi:glycosyltransferase involved in cell wall biosynthesis